MSTVQRCTDCGRLFGYLPRGLCAGCLTAREAAFARVRDWYRDNPGSPLAQATEATEVPVGLISAWVAEGRLAHVPVGDDVTAPLREAEERREALRRALADSTTGAAPAPAPADRAPGARRAGMYGRER